jgi:hypothetical protein
MRVFSENNIDGKEIKLKINNKKRGGKIKTKLKLNAILQIIAEIICVQLEFTRKK